MIREHVCVYMCEVWSWFFKENWNSFFSLTHYSWLPPPPLLLPYFTSLFSSFFFSRLFPLEILSLSPSLSWDLIYNESIGGFLINVLCGEQTAQHREEKNLYFTFKEAIEHLMPSWGGGSTLETIFYD